MVSSTHVSIQLIEKMMECGDGTVGEGNKLIHELFGQLWNGFGARKEVEQETVVGSHSTQEK